MATHNFIMDSEDSILYTKQVAKSIASAYETECKLEGNGRPYKINRDCWGTLYVNMIVARNALNEALEKMKGEFK